MHLTQKAADAMPLVSDGRRYVKDDATPGLSLVVGKTKKSWRYQRDLWRDGARKQVVMVLSGDHSLQEARAWAHEQRTLIGRGTDPTAKPEQPKERSGPGDWTVRQLMETRLAYMESSNFAASVIYNFKAHTRYLALVPGLPTTLVRDLTKTQCGAAHRAISLQGMRGPAPVTANNVFRDLSAAWNYAKDRLDDYATMPAENPCKGAERNPVGKVQASIPGTELPEWWAIVAALPPVKRHMHRIGLLTGLRWTTLQCLERAWVDGNRLTIPAGKIKSRRGAVLPLSAALLDEIRAAEAAANFVCPGSPYLFPSPTSTTGHMATDDDRQLIKRGWSGKLRRKTYRTQAEVIGCPTNIAGTLIDHAAPGLLGNYVHRGEMFDDLLGWQERISERLLTLCNVRK